MCAESVSAGCGVLVRNARHSIVGWLAWHLALGFQHILVVDGGTDDGTAEIVRILAREWPVTWTHAPCDNLKAEDRRLFLTRHALALLTAAQNPSEWISILDGDEYLAPEPDLAQMLQRGNHADGIALNWCIFGSSTGKTHPVARHIRRADSSFVDHHITRLIVKSSALPALDQLTKPMGLDLPHAHLIHPDGQRYSPAAVPRWQGGCILHYPCMASVRDTHLSPLLLRHFDRHDHEDLTPQRFLHTMRQMQNRLLRTLLAHGLTRLHAMAAEHAATDTPPISDADFSLPMIEEHKGFQCERLRPHRRHRLLLSPDITPAYGLTRLVTLRSTTTGHFLTADPSPDNPQEPKEALIGIVQDGQPRLLCLFSPDDPDATLGDVPSPHHMAIMQTRHPHTSGLFCLPEKSGHADTVFEAVPYNTLPPPEMIPLPRSDNGIGLNLEDLLLWVESHSRAGPQDICRALCLLNHRARLQLQQTIPVLQPFLS